MRVQQEEQSSTRLVGGVVILIGLMVWLAWQSF